MTQRVLIKSKVSKKRALASDTDNDHFYGLQNQQIPKRRKLTKRVEAAKKREVEASAMAISGLDLVTEQGGRYVFTALPRTDDNRNRFDESSFSLSGAVLTSATLAAPYPGPRSQSLARGKSSLL